MIVCICNNVNDKSIKKTLEDKTISSVKELIENIKVCDQCMKCSYEINNIFLNYKESIRRSITINCE